MLQMFGFQYIFYSFTQLIKEGFFYFVKKKKNHFFNSFVSVKFFFYLGFLSQPFANQRTVGEGGGHFFNSSLSLPPASQTLRH